MILCCWVHQLGTIINMCMCEPAFGRKIVVYSSKLPQVHVHVLCACPALVTRSSHTCLCWEATVVVTETGYSGRQVENTSRVGTVGPVLPFGASAGCVYALKPVEYLVGLFWNHTFANWNSINISAIYWKKPCWDVKDVKGTRCFLRNFVV